ncbi:MAG: hypothetical protein ACXVCP_00585 [Bdellovibrio sp.]
MTKNSFLITLISCFSLLWHFQAKAEQAASGKKPKVVKVRFDDELVKGATEKPDLSNMDVKRNFNFKKLIRVRENFLNEMENGLDDFKGK